MKILYYIILVILAALFVVTIMINIAHIVNKMLMDMYDPSLWDNFGVPVVIFFIIISMIVLERVFYRKNRF